jgi:hypothetical protein
MKLITRTPLLHAQNSALNESARFNVYADACRMSRKSVAFAILTKQKRVLMKKLKMNITYTKNARRQLLGVKFNQAIEHF